MRKRVLINTFAVVLLFVFLLAGCQPTPDRQAVVQHGEFEDKIKETAAPAAPFEAPAHWMETDERDPLTIHIDTDVIMPDVSAFPVAKVEPVAFSQERVNEVVSYLIGDGKLVSPHVKTKSDYDEEIILAKRGQEVDGEYVVTEETNVWVEELERMRDAAPDDSPIGYADATLTYDTKDGGLTDTSTSKNYLDVNVEGNNGEDEGHIFLYNYAEDENDFTDFGYYKIGDYLSESDIKARVESSRIWEEDFPELGLSYGESLEAAEKTEERLKTVEFAITMEDAQAQAQKVLDELKIEGMYLLSAEPALLDAFNESAQGEADQGGYVFEFIRQLGGIPGYGMRSYGYFQGEEPPAYSPPYYVQEDLRIVITGDGIGVFRWQGCARITESVTENTELAAFEDVVQRFKDRVFYECAYTINQNGAAKGMQIDVESIEMHVGYVDVKDNPQQAMLVPVWVFNTTNSYITSEGKRHGQDRASYIFNAIDGGYIKEPMD
jgi:hypothetical protein